MSTRGTVTIRSEDDRRQIATWARNVDLGTVVTFRKKSRSTEQSAKMWAMLHEVADQVEWYGAKLEAEDWKDVMTASLRHARVVPGIDKGTYVPLGMHTSTMTIEEMTNLIELIYAFGAEHGVVFKDPKENSNSGPSPSGPDSADGISPSAEAGDALASPASSIEDDMRGQLIAFTAAIVVLLKNDLLTDASKSEFIEQTELDWQYAISPIAHSKMASIASAAGFVIAGKRTLTQFINYVASDLLDCADAEIGA